RGASAVLVLTSPWFLAHRYLDTSNAIRKSRSASTVDLRDAADRQVPRRDAEPVTGPARRPTHHHARRPCLWLDLLSNDYGWAEFYADTQGRLTTARPAARSKQAAVPMTALPGRA